MGARDHRPARGRVRRHGQLLRGAEGRHAALQTSKQHPTEHGEEDKRIQDGVQMYGEHQRFPGGCEAAGSAGAGDLPDRGPVGATEPQLRGHLPAESGKEGEKLRQTLDRTQRS